jgi:hypothetical protein
MQQLLTSPTAPEEFHMQIVVSYSILKATSPKDLEDKVKEAIKRGWQPLGGLAVNNGEFFQAMAGS